MKLVVFEDAKVSKLSPIALTRPAFELKCGITSLGVKTAKAFSSEIAACFIREYLAPVQKQVMPGVKVNDMSALEGEVTLVNARCLFTGRAPELPVNSHVEKDGDLLAAKLDAKTLASCRGDSIDAVIGNVKSKTEKKDPEDTGITVIEYPWDLINNNPAAITSDFKAIGKNGIEGNMAEGSYIYGPKESVYIARGAEVHPHVCIDTKIGPVMIDEGAEIQPHTRIEGPAYIGKKAAIVGAKIREGCSIGPVCKVGGEVEESIIHGYSNKFHDGFLGHSYVGEWVNLGALTTNSDLKNDYSSVAVKIDGKLVDTGSLKVGSFIGDHTKTSIGTFLNTGSNIGVLCILVATGGVLPKYIPTGIWFIKGEHTKGFGFKKLLQTSEAVMNRRKVKITDEYRQMLKTVYDSTKPERDSVLKR